MKQIILISAILMLSLAINAQKENQTKYLEDAHQNLLLSSESRGYDTESDVSAAAREFNDSGVRKVLTQHDYLAATELFRKAIESDNRCWACHYNLGMSFINNEKYDEAIGIFTRLTAIKPEYANAYVGLGDAFCKKGNLIESVTAYQKAARLSPNDAVILSNLGNALHQTKNYEEALNYHNQAIKSNSTLAGAYNNRGATLSALGRQREALKSLQIGLTLLPNSAEAQNNLGVVLSSMGKEKEALKHYLAAIRLRTDWSVALYNLALSYFELGNREMSRQQIAKLEKVDLTLAEAAKKIFFRKYLVNVKDVK